METNDDTRRYIASERQSTEDLHCVAASMPRTQTKFVLKNGNGVRPILQTVAAHCCSGTLTWTYDQKGLMCGLSIPLFLRVDERMFEQCGRLRALARGRRANGNGNDKRLHFLTTDLDACKQEGHILTYPQNQRTILRHGGKLVCEREGETTRKS
jgi:hypothetical protein